MIRTSRIGLSLLNTLRGVFSRRLPRTWFRKRSPRNLAMLAGRSQGFESLEALEARQLLFTVSIGPADVDPATGIGTVQIPSFGYHIPYLVGAQPEDVDDEVVTEEFADENGAQWANFNPRVPPSGTTFLQSNIRISYQSQSTTPAILVAGPDAGQGGQNDEDLRIALSTTDRMTFSFLGGQDANLFPRLATAARITINTTTPQQGGGDGDGLKTDAMAGTRIELLLNGQVVDTLIGPELLAIAANVQGGIQYTLARIDGFDAFRFASAADVPDNGTYSDVFTLDDISVSFPGGRYTDFLESRLFAVTGTFSGPVGASIQFLDVYGRDMVATLAVGVPPQAEVPLIDPNDDGRPDFNDGIGRVIINGGDVNTNVSLWGGTPVFNTEANQWEFVLANDMAGQLDDFEEAGFGYTITPGQNPMASGLADAGASIIIGSPYVRNRATENSYQAQPAFPPISSSFTRQDQGIFVNGSIGSINAHALLFGSSAITGSAGRVAVGVLMGSLRVEGDLGQLIVAGDAALWQADPAQGQPTTRSYTSTDAELVVGRTVGEVLIGGRSNLAITVFGDINNPSRATRNFLDYAEREVTLGFAPPQDDPIGATIRANLANNASASQHAVVFGDSFFRNDGLQDAEYVGYNGTTVRITGTLGGRDGVNTAEDATDVFAFAADMDQDIVIQVEGLAGYARIVDRFGRVVAAIDSGNSGRGLYGNVTASTVMRYRPDHTDVFYLVLNNSPDDGAGNSANYTATITGMAPTTFGQFRTVFGSGGSTDPFVLSLNAGNMGSVRVATGAIDSSGGFTSGAVINNLQDAQGLFEYQNSTVSVAGNLYNLFAGGDIVGAQILVGRNFGTLVTGQALPFFGAVTQGDIESLELRVGGTISIIDAQGAIAADQDPMFDNTSGIVNIRSGTLGGAGHIGQILAGAYVGSGLSVQTSPGSIVDQFLVGNTFDGGDSQFAGQMRGTPPVFRLGAGSDIRFADFGLIQSNGSADSFTRIGLNQSFTFVDDAGAAVRVSVNGGGAGAAGSFVDVRTLAINGSQGVAIARVTGNLIGGAILNFEVLTTGVVSVGRIDLTVDQNGSEIRMFGVGQLDVYRINIGGGPLAAISNSTNGGDIVAIDAGALRAINISRGNLGETQTSPAIRPSSLAKYLGLVSGGAQGGVLGPIGVTIESINVGDATQVWNGTDIFLPINANNPQLWMNPYVLEFIGSPVDPYLSGVIVRGGDLRSVVVSGSVGDVIVQGGALLSVVANNDGVTPTGQFHGIFGTIYAPVINDIDVGDGLRGTGAGPFAQAGIFADDDIVSVRADRVADAVIAGTIIARNAIDGQRTVIGENDTPVNPPVSGIRTVRVVNGKYDGAFIHSGALDDFWISSVVGKNQWFMGDLTLVEAVNSDFFRSIASGRLVTQVSITGGAFDASTVRAVNDIGQVAADEYRNSTALGVGTEFVANSIRATNNIGSIITNGNLGNIADLNVSAGGSLVGQVSARNIERSSFAINNQLSSIIAVNDFRGNSIVTGELISLNVTGDIRSSSISVAGPIRNITVAGEITLLDLISSGPFGRIDNVQSGGQMTGNFISSGPIGNIVSQTSDIIATISTTDEVDGNLTLLRAGRDLRVDLQVFGNAQTILAGRNIGAKGEPRNRAIDIRGNLGNLTATSGQIYSDILVGQSITGTITNGRVSMRPGNDLVASANIIAFGRINSIVLNGDFNGDIVSYSGGIASITITNGSLRPDNRIAAYDGDIELLRIKGGDLLGDVYTDRNIRNLEVLNGDDGFKGQIGIASFRRNNKQWKNDIRNELPPGVARTVGVDGVTIQALGNIDRIYVQQGSIWESRIIAGDTITLVDVGLQIRNDALTSGRTGVIAAGNRIDTVRAGQFVGGLFVLAGLKSFGDDNLPGGTGNNADTVVAGTINSLSFAKDVGNVSIAAGVNAGPNGSYLTNDDTFSPGFSSIGTIFVGGARQAIKAFAAGSIGSVTPGVVTDISQPQSLPSTVVGISGVLVPTGVVFNFVTTSGQAGSFIYQGTGGVYWNAARNRITINGVGSSLVVAANNGILTDFNILSTDNSSLQSLTVNAELRGASNVFLDAALGSAVFNRRVDSTGIIGSGGDVGTLTFNQGLLDGDITTRNLNVLDVVGDFGRTGTTADAIATVRDLSLLRVTGGVMAGSVSSEQDIDSVQLSTMNEGGVRAGRSILAFTSAAVSRSRVSANDTLGPVTVNGDFFDSVLYAGGDLGTDANFGGTGTAADRVTNGTITSVNINGNFRESDIAAGVIRGVDGFLGTGDDLAADGRSSIGPVVISGNQTGSNFNSEQYRIISTGTIGSVSVNSLPFTERNNFRVTRLTGDPVPVQVLSSRSVEDGRVYTHELMFNQPIDASSIPNALNIAQVREGGVLVGLAQGTDYSFRYNAANLTLTITFSRSITDRNLPVAPGVPGPGLYRIILDADSLRGETQLSRLDGNGDGTVGDDFSNDDFIGDAGDKINSGNPNSVAGIDFYGASPLDLFLDANDDSDDLPDINSTFTLRGVLGDHPDVNSNTFRIGGDVDVYRITLRAGQILRLGAMQGIALAAERGIYDQFGNLLAFSGGAQGRIVVDANGGIRQLPAADPTNIGDVTGNDEYLVMQTGTYFIAVGSSLQNTNIADVNAVLNIVPAAGTIGSYAFTVQVFDDGDTGFAGDSNSGDGQLLPNTPIPQDFAGSDGIPGTADDLKTYVLGDFTFTWDRKNLANPNDDHIRGTNSAGTITIDRINGNDGIWGNANDRIQHIVNSAIGLPGNTGTPSTVQPDIDIFRLNGGLPIVPGTRFTATLRLTETGSNIGLASANTEALFASTLSAEDRLSLLDAAAGLPANVQFSLFEVPNGSGFANARLVGSPSDFLPIGGQAAMAESNGAFKYGYNADGDFYIDFVVPGAQGIAGQVPASYALYIQGAVRSDYQLDVVQVGTRAFNPQAQRVLLETNGGQIEWLEAGEGTVTTLDAFRAAAAGFAGQINGIDVDEYILTTLLVKLNSIFASANANVVFSYSPLSFEGQPFSTVFLAGNSEPNAFFNNSTFGASEHIDAFNADSQDEGVVFVTSLTTLGNDPSQAGVDRFVDQFAAAVSRRVGELMGLSFETSNASAVSPVPILASNSVNTPPAGGGVYAFSNTTRNLAGRTDVANSQIFFLGTQNSLALLNRFAPAQF